MVGFFAGGKSDFIPFSIIFFFLRKSRPEKVNDFQPIAKIQKLSTEKRKANRKHEQQQLSVFYWSAKPRQDITLGQPYTAKTHCQQGNTAAQIPRK